MKSIIWIVALFPTLIAVSLAGAQPPSSAAHVDPNAPCYRWPAVDLDGDGVFDRVDHCPGTPQGCSVDEWGCHSDGDRDGVCDGVDRCPNTPAGMTVDEAGCHEGAGAMRDTRGTEVPAKKVEPPKPARQPEPRPVSEVERRLLETGRIRLENVYFETGSARLLPESEATLNEVGSTLEKFADLRIEVEGHTDTRGPARGNMNLSQTRAEAVRDYLVSRFSLRRDHVIAKGYGETRPETKERNDEELLRNRRVELRVLNPEVLPRGIEVEKE